MSVYIIAMLIDFPEPLAMKKVFAMFDQAKTGFVETNKFVNILNTLGQNFDEDDLKQKIEEVDTASEYRGILWSRSAQMEVH